MHRLPSDFAVTKDNTSFNIFILSHRPKCTFSPLPEFCITIVFNSPGYYSRPNKSRKQWLYKVFGGGLGGGVNKVLYGLCENSEFHSFLVLNMRTLLRLQTFYLFIGIKYKCLSQSCFSIFLICCELLSITVRLDDASNQSVAKPMKMKQTNVA